MGVSSETKHMLGRKMKSLKEVESVCKESETREEDSEFARVFAKLRTSRDWN